MSSPLYSSKQGLRVFFEDILTFVVPLSKLIHLDFNPNPTQVSEGFINNPPKRLSQIDAATHLGDDPNVVRPTTVVRKQQNTQYLST